MERLVEFYVPLDLGISVGISRAEGLLWNQLEEEKRTAGIKDISKFVSFIGIYHC